MKSLKLIVASFFLLVLSLPAFAQIQTAGELLIDLNVTRGTNLMTGQNTNTPAEVSLVRWTNYGALGGGFDAASNSIWAANILAGNGNAYSNAPFITNVLGTNAPATFAPQVGGNRLMIADFATPPQLQGQVSFSVECWFYESSIPAEPRGLFGWTLEAPPSGDSGELSGATSAAYHANANTLNWNTAGTNISTLVWHYGVITYDGSSNQIAYLDGVPVNTNVVSLTFNTFNAAGTTNGHPTIFSGLNTIPISGTVGSATRGAIAALRVHTDALSAAQVAANFAAGAVSTPGATNLALEIDQVGSPQGGNPTLNANLLATGDPTSTSSTFMFDTVDHGRTTNGWAHYVVAQSGNQFAGPFSANTGALPNSTKFYVRAYSTNNGDTNISAPVTFVSQGPPVIANGVAAYNGPTSDILYGNLQNTGFTGGAGTAVVVFYGPTDGGSNPAAWASSNIVVPNNAVNGQVQFTDTGEAPLATYFFTYAAANFYGQMYATPSVQFQEGALFTLNTANLPNPSLPPAADVPVTSWVSQAGTFVAAVGGGGSSGTNVVRGIGGVKWLLENANPAGNMYVPPASFPGGAPGTITTVGGSVVTIVKPELPAAAGPWENIVAAYFAQLGLAMNVTANVAINADSVASITINNGGNGYTSPPSVTIAAPSSYPGGGIAAMDVQATGTAVLGTGANAGKVVSVTINNGGHGYPAIGPGANGIGIYTIKPPTVTFSAPTGANPTNATGTANLTATVGQQLIPDVNQNRPVDTAGAAANGRNTRSSVYLLYDQPSIITLVAGDGLDSGVATDNNFRLFVNGILVEDSDFGFLSGVQLTTNGVANGQGWSGSGYTNLSGGNQTPPPNVTFPAPTANAINGALSTATGVAVLGTGTNTGRVVGVTMTSAGSGYTGNGILPGNAGSGNPAVVFDAPLISGGVTATGIALGTPLGQYSPVVNSTTIGAPAVGYNGAGTGILKYNLEGYAGNSTFDIGNDALNIDPWSGFNGFLGDTYVFGEALSAAARATLEANLAAKFITGASLGEQITFTHDANSTITPVANAYSTNVGNITTIVQGNNETYTLAANPGFALFQNIDGAGAVLIPPGTFTFTNVSAAHTIAVTGVAIPLQEVTVTYGAGGAILTNGVVAPSGSSNSYVGGTSPSFLISPNNGFALGTVTIDGTVVANSTIQGLGTYTYALIGGNLGATNHTIDATFTALPVTPVSASVPKSDQLLFALDTSLYPQTFPTTLTNLPVFYPTHAPLARNQSGATPNLATNFLDVSGVIWESNIEQNAGNTTAYDYYAPFQGVPNSTIIPSSGATIVLTCNPTENGSGAGDPWHMIVDVFFGEMGLSVNPGSGLIQAFEDSNAFGNGRAQSTVAIPKGTNAVLSEVIQPNGSFQVFFNTVQVISNAGGLHAGQSGFIIRSGFNGNTYADNITIGDEAPDPWAAFDGLIGNVYVYQSALSTTDRQTLEAALLTQFHAVVPATYNWNGPNNGNWSALANWSNTVPFATNTVPGLNGFHGVPTFSTATAGPTVLADVSGIKVSGIAFNTNATIGGANVLTIDSGTTANPIITVATNATGTISDSISSLEGLNVTGGGTLVLSGGATITGAFNIAPATAASATVNINGGTVSTVVTVPTNRSPGVMLGGSDDTATVAILNLNAGGNLTTPSIGTVTETGGVLVPPSNFGAIGILNFNGGSLTPSDSDSANTGAIADGTAHLIFNTTHTYISAGGATINMQGGFIDSINTPIEHSGGSVQDGGLTVHGTGFLSLLQADTYTGPTTIGGSFFDNSTVTFTLTNSLGGNTLNIASPCIANLPYTGTSYVYQLNIDGTPEATGTWGSSLSGAAHQDDAHFTGSGTVTVVGTNGTTAPHITGTAITGNGAFVTLSGTGGKATGVYSVLASTTANAPLSTWTTVAQGNFTSGPAFNVSIPYTNGTPTVFYDIVIP